MVEPEISRLIQDYHSGWSDPGPLIGQLRVVVATGFVHDAELRSLTKSGSTARFKYVGAALPDRVAVDRARMLMSEVGLVDWDSMASRLSQAIILHDIDAGILPEPAELPSRRLVNLEDGEQIMGIFGPVTRYLQYSGSRLKRDGEGMLVVTNKNLNFVADNASKAAKLPAREIISTHIRPDSLVVNRLGVLAEPEIYKMADPWFAGHLISRLGKMASLVSGYGGVGGVEPRGSPLSRLPGR